jgi:hypothetical protein
MQELSAYGNHCKPAASPSHMHGPSANFARIMRDRIQGSTHYIAAAIVRIAPRAESAVTNALKEC